MLTIVAFSWLLVPAAVVLLALLIFKLVDLLFWPVLKAAEIVRRRRGEERPKEAVLPALELKT